MRIGGRGVAICVVYGGGGGGVSYTMHVEEEGG